MNAQLIGIGQPRLSRNGDVNYYRIKLVLDNGSFVMTDIVPAYRNWKYWKPVLVAGRGTWMKGIKMLYEGKVDADSRVKIIEAPKPPKEKKIKAVKVERIPIQVSMF
jgi:hypothetical protein